MINKIKQYGVYGTIRVLVDYLFSKIMYPNAKLIRRPFFIRGKVNIGSGFISGSNLVLDAINTDSILDIGKDVIVNSRVQISAARCVIIGDRVLMASGVYISDHGHGTYIGDQQSSPLIPPNDRSLYISDVSIGNDVWLGQNVSILPGVVIGEGSIIGAGSVVTKSIDSYSIAVGAPAVVIKKYSFEHNKWLLI
jgi:acetyltransferase-like isoleucine patch superfamily enzyme